MNIVAIAIIIYLFRKKDTRKSDVAKVSAFPIIALMILSFTVNDGFLVLVTLGIMSYIIIKALKGGTHNKRAKDYGWQTNDNRWDPRRNTVPEGTMGGYEKRVEYGRDGKPLKPVSRNAGKRRRVVNKFNEEYGLNLTDNQVLCIVDASYMSAGWKTELTAMNQKYENVYEWLESDTRWLRAYLYVLSIQDVSPDFEEQHRIVTSTFQEIFNYSDSLGDMSLDEKIKTINEKYFASFNRVTYMIAYRFLEYQGFKHKLDSVEAFKYQDEMDRLKGKYDDYFSEFSKSTTYPNI